MLQLRRVVLIGKKYSGERPQGIRRRNSLLSYTPLFLVLSVSAEHCRRDKRCHGYREQNREAAYKGLKQFNNDNLTVKHFDKRVLVRNK